MTDRTIRSIDLPWADLVGADDFVGRHIGPTTAEQELMLRTIGAASLDELLEQTVPASIRLAGPLALPAPAALGWRVVIRRLRQHCHDLPCPQAGGSRHSDTKQTKLVANNLQLHCGPGNRTGSRVVIGALIPARKPVLPPKTAFPAPGPGRAAVLRRDHGCNPGKVRPLDCLRREPTDQRAADGSIVPMLITIGA